jgi:hypothetical protein
MRGIVYCSSFERGVQQLEQIIRDYEAMGITYDFRNYRRGITTCSVEFINGDYWKVVTASDRARGNYCNIAYIDRNIPTDIIETVIMPTIKRKPYQAYHYY